MSRQKLSPTAIVLFALVVVLSLLLVRQEVSSQTIEEPASDTVSSAASSNGVTLSYQGQLLDGLGQPAASGNVTMAFAIYDASTVGTGSSCWSETQTVTITDGRYNVLLGSTTLIPPSCFDTDSYLDLKINGEQLEPRQRLAGAGTAANLINTTYENGVMTVTGDVAVTGEAYEQYEGRTFTDNTPRWVRFAEGAGRNQGEFLIRWTRPAYHGHVRVAIGADYGTDDGLGFTILSSSFHHQSALSSIRVLMSGTYDKKYIEFYDAIGGTSAEPMIVQVYRYTGTGWDLIDMVDGEIPTGYASHEMPADVLFGTRSHSANAMVFDRNGRLGVRTTSPDATLSAIGRVRGSYDEAETEYVEIWHGGSHGFINMVGDGNLAFRHDDVTRMSLTDGGRLGIGTTTPAYMLDVTGGAQVGTDLNVVGATTLNSLAVEQIQTPFTINSGKPWEVDYNGTYTILRGKTEDAKFRFQNFGEENLLTINPDAIGIGKYLTMNQNSIYEVDSIRGVTENGNKVLEVDGRLRMTGSDFMMGSEDAAKRALVNQSFGGGRRLVINYSGDFNQGVYVNSDMDVTGALTVGSCGRSAQHDSDDVAANQCTPGSISTGAVIELGLLTQEEHLAGQIDRFTWGDVLCWSRETARLELCEEENNRLIMAVAAPNGYPVVLGAEPIKVIGPVQIGDLLVASDVLGYAMVNNNPAPGTVIAKAIEDFDGERGIIKAMINGN